MNEPRSRRYHRAKRRAWCLWAVTTALFCAAAMMTGASARLRGATAGLVPPYVLLLAAAYAVVTFPVTYYRSCRLERLYGLSEMPTRVWLRDYLKTALLIAAFGVVVAEIVYVLMPTTPDWWWLIAASALAALLALLTALAPMAILPLFHRYRPLARAALRQRLAALGARAGMRVLDVYEWRLGDRDRRAHAAIVGAGSTRRIVISDTLLADYSDDEIEVIAAHEIGHHVHRDVCKGLASEWVVLTGCFYGADAVLDRSWRALGLLAPHDPAGVPVVLMAGLVVWACAAPVLNALSRGNEKRADRFALTLTEKPDAFIAATRRMAAQNLAEDRPPRLMLWLFHTHPAVADRLAMAHGVIAAQTQAAARESGGPRASGAARSPGSPVETAGA